MALILVDQMALVELEPQVVFGKRARGLPQIPTPNAAAVSRRNLWMFHILRAAQVRDAHGVADLGTGGVEKGRCAVETVSKLGAILHM